MKDQTDIPVQEAIVVNDNNPQNNEAGSADILLNLEQLIKNHISHIDKIKEDLKIKKEMLDDVLNNDSTYKEHSEAAKVATKLKTATKQQILKTPQNAELSSQVKEMKTELKDLNGALSDYLREYGRMAGVNEIEGDDGFIREIILTAKLIKKNKV